MAALNRINKTDLKSILKQQAQYALQNQAR